MQVCIHRGSKEIGGSCVEVISHGKRLLIDLGLATFMRELLRSSGGKVWWQLFGFTGKLPERIDLYVSCAMPSTNCNELEFAEKPLEIDDKFHFHYLYFQESDNKATKIITSLNLREKYS